MPTAGWGRLVQRSRALPPAHFLTLLNSAVCTRQSTRKHCGQGVPPPALEWKNSNRNQPFARSRGLQHRFPGLYGPISVPSSLDDSDVCVCGELVVGERASVGECLTFSAGWMYTSIRTKKKRGKKEVVHKNAEQIDTKASEVFRWPPLRLEDHATTAEPPAAVAATIRAETIRAIRGGKTSRMFAFRNKYRLRRLVGLTHSETRDESSESISRKPQGRAFVTPLTRLQHQATLPRSTHHARFPFRHSFRYTVAWGGPQVAPFVPSACCVTFRIGDLGLTASQRKQLAAVLGPDRMSGDLCYLESDLFPEVNKNAAHLGASACRLAEPIKYPHLQGRAEGDALQLLIREIKKA